MQPHRSNALDGALLPPLCPLTVARTLACCGPCTTLHRPLSWCSWSWSHQPHDRAARERLHPRSAKILSRLDSQLWRQLWAARASRRCIAWPNPASPMPKGVKLTEGE